MPLAGLAYALAPGEEGFRLVPAVHLAAEVLEADADRFRSEEGEEELSHRRPHRAHIALGAKIRASGQDRVRRQSALPHTSQRRGAQLAPWPQLRFVGESAASRSGFIAIRFDHRLSHCHHLDCSLPYLPLAGRSGGAHLFNSLPPSLAWRGARRRGGGNPRSGSKAVRATQFPRPRRDKQACIGPPRKGDLLSVLLHLGHARRTPSLPRCLRSIRSLLDFPQPNHEVGPTTEARRKAQTYGSASAAGHEGRLSARHMP